MNKLSGELRFGQRGLVDVIVFGAHPDDAELLCGGTIAKLIQAGQRVAVVDGSEGELSTNGHVELRRSETEQASKILELTQRLNLGFPDGVLGHSEGLVRSLVRILRELQPKLIIGPPQACRHPDHQALYAALKEAHFFCGLLKYEPQLPAITRPKFIQYVEVANTKADFVVDISQQWNLRIQAILAYKSQFEQEKREKTFINEGFLERLERRYRQCGEDIGTSYAEPFLCETAPKIALPTDLC